VQEGRPGDIRVAYPPHETIKFFEQMGLLTLSEDRRTPSSSVDLYRFQLLQPAFHHVDWLREPKWKRWAISKWENEPSRDFIFLLIGSLLSCIFSSLVSVITLLLSAAISYAVSRFLP
jgi:hypothetical protein